MLRMSGKKSEFWESDHASDGDQSDSRIEEIELPVKIRERMQPKKGIDIYAESKEGTNILS